MRPTENSQDHWRDVEALARRNRSERARDRQPAKARIRVCFDGVSGVRCFEVEVLQPDVTGRQSGVMERDMGSACEPMS